MTANRQYIEEAIHTLAASRWTLLLARLFGHREWIWDLESGSVVTLSVWRGKRYLLSVKRKAQASTDA